MNTQTLLIGDATRWLKVRNKGVNWAFIVTFILPFCLYLLTLAPTIYNLDSAELTTAAATGGIVRATGYPLYLLLGKVWSWLPVGDVGYRLNLFSAFCGATTIWLAGHILRRLGIGRWAQFGALGLLATAPYFWSLSLMAEVYTLHVALMAGVILCLLHWAEHPTYTRLAIPIVLLGLSLGNHAATVLLIPGCMWYVISQQPQQLKRPKFWITTIIAGLLGISVYLYLPWRYQASPLFNYAGYYDATGTFVPVNLQTVDGFLWLVTGRSFSGQMFGYGLHEIGEQVGHYGRELWQAFFAIGIGPGLFGWGVLLRRDWRLGGMLTLLFLCNAIFYINYRVVDKNTMFLPNYLVWALWLGVGYHTLAQWVKTQPSAILLLRGVMVGAVLLAMGWNWQRVDLSNDWSTRQQSQQILDTVAPNAIVLGWWDVVPGIQYLQLVEEQRPDVLAINRFLISGDDMLTLIEAEASKRPLYINNPPLSLISEMTVSKEGALYRLEP